MMRIARPGAENGTAKSDLSWMDAVPSPTPPPSPNPEFAVPPGQMSGFRANVGAGLKEGVTGTLAQVAGAPADMITRMPNLALKAFGLPQIPTTTDAVHSALEGFSIPSSDVSSGSPGEAVTRAAARGASAMAAGGLVGGPMMAGAATPTGIAAGGAGGLLGEIGRQAAPEQYKPAAEFAGNIIGGGLVAGPVAAAKGLADPLRPIVRDFTAPLGAAGRTRLAAERVTGSATDPAAVRETLNNPPAPLVPGSEATPYQLTGDPGLGTLERGVSRDARYAPGFNELRGEQNTARVAAIEGQGPPVPASEMGPWFRKQLDDLNARGDETVGNDRAVTQSAVDRIGDITTPHEAGATVRQGVETARAPVVAASDQALAGAQRGAEQSTRALGGDTAGQNVEQGHGVRMRGVAPEGETLGTGLEGVRVPVKIAAGKLFDAIDPEGTLALDVSGVGRVGRELAGGVNTRMGGKLTGAESDVIDAASKLRSVELFSDLRDLRTNTTTALREIKADPKLGAETPPYRRMSILLGSIDDAMSKAVGEAATRDEAAVSSGAMHPGASISSRIRGATDETGSARGRGSGQGSGADAGGRTDGIPPAGGTAAEGQGRRGSVAGNRGVAPFPATGRKPDTLHDWLIANGGVKDESGEFAAADLGGIHHRGGGRLINPSGMSHDYAREGAVEQGFLPPNADVNDFRTAVQSQQPVYRISEAADAANRANQTRQGSLESHDRFMAATNVDDAVTRLGVRLSPAEHEHATFLQMNGAHPEDAVRQAVSAGEDEVLQRNAEREAMGAPGVPAGARQAEMPVDRAQLEPNFTAEDRDALRAANAAYAEYKARFRQGAVGDVLASDSRTASGYRVSDSAVPARLFAGGTKGSEAADSLIKATGSRAAAMGVLGDYPAFSLRSAAEEMGTLSVPKYQKWLDSHRAVMDKFPELRAQFDTAAKARGMLDDLRTQRAELDKSYPIKPGWGDAEIMQRFVAPGPKGFGGAANLLRETNGSPAVLKSTEDYLASSLRNAAEVKSGPNAGTLDAGAYGRWMKQYDSFLSHPAMTGVKVRFQTAADAQATLDQSIAAHVEARKAYETSVARHFLHQDADPVSAIGAILKSPTAPQQMGDLARLTSSDPVARQSVQRATIDYMLRELKSNNPVGASLEDVYLKSDQLQTFIRRHVGDEGAGALRKIMTPAQLDALGRVALDLRRSNLSNTANKAPADSSTAANLSAMGAHGHNPSMVGTLAALEMLGEGAGHIGNAVVPGSRWIAKIGGMIGVPVFNNMRKNGFNKIDDLVAEAVLRPEKMKALFDVLPPERALPSRRAALMAQIGALAATSAQEKR